MLYLDKSIVMCLKLVKKHSLGDKHSPSFTEPQGTGGFSSSLEDDVGRNNREPIIDLI